MEVDRAKPWRRRRNAKMDVDVVASADDLFADEQPPEAPRAEETGGPGPDPGPCVVCQEVPLVKTVRAPDEPTKKERDDHAALHWPFSRWCIHCMRGLCRADAHRQQDAEPRMLQSRR